MKHFFILDKEEWCQVDEKCCGERQSPVALPPWDSALPLDDSDDDPALVCDGGGDLASCYPGNMPGTFVNTGHSLQFDPGKDEAPVVITGGPLHGSKYVFAQYHFHWGTMPGQGSEHIMAGERWYQF